MGIYFVDNVEEEGFVLFLHFGIVDHDLAESFDEIVETDLPNMLLHVLHLTEAQIGRQHVPQTVLQEFPKSSWTKFMTTVNISMILDFNIVIYNIAA